MKRLPIPEYVMALAHVAALRSEDPYRKVGAAALDKDNRVIGTAYNGLFPGFKAPDGFWASRDERQKYMLEKLGVDVKLNTAVTPDVVTEINPDALIVAIGGEPIRPNIPGIDGANVIGIEESFAKCSILDYVIIGR